MEILKQLHKGYEEWRNAKEKGIKIRQYFGKYQYIYSHGSIKISLVELLDLNNDCWFWEIAKLTTDGVDGESIERFNIKLDAEKRIKEILNGS